MANLNALSGEMLGKVATDLLNKMNPYIDQLDDYRKVMSAVKKGEINIDQVQIMEDWTLRVTPPAPTIPAASCTVEMAASMTELAESKNGKKDEKEAVGAETNG